MKHGGNFLILGMEQEVEFINEQLANLCRDTDSLSGNLGAVMVCGMELPRKSLVDKFDWILCGESMSGKIKDVDQNKVILFVTEVRESHNGSARSIRMINTKDFRQIGEYLAVG